MQVNMLLERVRVPAGRASRDRAGWAGARLCMAAAIALALCAGSPVVAAEDEKDDVSLPNTAGGVLDGIKSGLVIQATGNLLLNGDFEGVFKSGVAHGWNTFNVKGATFKENAKLGPIGGGIYGSSHGKEDAETIRMSGKVNLVDASRFDMVSRLQTAFGPDTITIGKLMPEAYFDGRPLDGDPYRNGARFADYCESSSRKDNHWPTCYYGLNEPNVNDATDFVRIAAFELGFTRRLHELGLRSVVINHSVGTPGIKTNMYLPEVRELLAEADFTGYHSYGAPQAFSAGGQVMCGTESLYDYSLRWRQFAAEYQKNGWRFPPMIYTEATTWGGWTENEEIESQDILKDLVCFSDKIREDVWTIGLCVFATGAWPGQPWQEWDITKYMDIIDGARDYNIAHPVDAHGGTKSQQIVGLEGVVDGGIVQSVPAEKGRAYRFSGHLKWEYWKGYGRKAAVKVGWDPTGQTKDAGAKSIEWSKDLIREGNLETDMWYPFSVSGKAKSANASVWVRVIQKEEKPLVRVSIDDLVVAVEE